jgi:hypothetical protein
MGVFLSFDARSDVLMIRFEGDVTDEVLMTRFQTVREWFAANGPRSNITDFSAVQGMDVSIQTVSRLSTAAPLVPDGYQRIIVAPQDKAFGMSRMYEMQGSMTRDYVHVVRNLEEAYRLAGVIDPQFSTILDW